MKKIVLTLGIGLMFTTLGMAQFNSSWYKKKKQRVTEKPITSKIYFDAEDEVQDKVKEYKLEHELQAKGVEQVMEYSEVTPKEVEEKKPVGIFREIVVSQIDAAPEPVGIPEGYTGYLVEILKTKERLNADHPIYFMHGYVVEEEVKGEGYSYMIGDFEHEIDAQDFIDRQLIGRYDNLEVVQYKNGERIPR